MYSQFENVESEKLRNVNQSTLLLLENAITVSFENRIEFLQKSVYSTFALFDRL